MTNEQLEQVLARAARDADRLARCKALLAEWRAREPRSRSFMMDLCADELEKVLADV